MFNRDDGQGGRDGEWLSLDTPILADTALSRSRKQCNIIQIIRKGAEANICDKNK